jgi:hypothetical protein
MNWSRRAAGSLLSTWAGDSVILNHFTIAPSFFPWGLYKGWQEYEGDASISWSEENFFVKRGVFSDFGWLGTG